jgi:hypothetical protein
MDCIIYTIIQRGVLVYKGDIMYNYKDFLAIYLNRKELWELLSDYYGHTDYLKDEDLIEFFDYLLNEANVNTLIITHNRNFYEISDPTEFVRVVNFIL